MNAQNRLWIESDQNLEKVVYIEPNKNVAFKNGGDLALYAFSGNAMINWFTFEPVSENSNYYKTTISVSMTHSVGIIFVCYSGNELNWSNVIRQTGDLDLHTYKPSNLYTPTNLNGEGGKTVGTWSIYQA